MLHPKLNILPLKLVLLHFLTIQYKNSNTIANQKKKMVFILQKLFTNSIVTEV